MPGRRIRLALLAVPLLLLGIAFAAGAAPTTRDVERAIRGAGAVAPIAFVLVYVGWTVLMLPGSVPTLAAGALFGFGVGASVSLIGADTGATAAFLVARRAARRGESEVAGPRVARLERWLKRNGFAALVSARLMPGVPFNALNYAAGAAGVPTRPYVLATVLGIIPGTLSYAAIGSSLTHSGSLGLIVALYGIRAVAVAIIALARVRRARTRGSFQLADDPQ